MKENNAPTIKQNTNKINEFLDARYVSAIEACWRIFHYPMHGQSPSTVRLPIHLENEQSVCYLDTDNLKETVLKNTNTPLTEYFKLNASDDPLPKSLLYHEFPKHYVCKVKTKEWKKRKHPNNHMVGRVYFVHQADTEKFCLRSLLLHRRGAKSFDDLKKTEHGQSSTF